MIPKGTMTKLQKQAFMKLLADASDARPPYSEHPIAAATWHGWNQCLTTIHMFLGADEEAEEPAPPPAQVHRHPPRAADKS